MVSIKYIKKKKNHFIILFSQYLLTFTGYKDTKQNCVQFNYCKLEIMHVYYKYYGQHVS